MNDRELEEKAKEVLKRIDLRKYVRFLKMEPHLLETLSQSEREGDLKSRQYQPDHFHAVYHGGF